MGLFSRAFFSFLSCLYSVCFGVCDFPSAINVVVTIILDEIFQIDIDGEKSKLQNLFAATKSIKDTQKLHSVNVIRQDVHFTAIQQRNEPCFLVLILSWTKMRSFHCDLLEHIS